MKNKILRSELIGFTIQIVSSSNKANIGMMGKIVDETRNTILVETEKGKRKRLMKSAIKMEIKEIGVIIEGDLLVGRPEDRVVKRYAKI